MSVLQFANRRQYDVSCPDGIDKRRWAAMTCMWDRNDVSHMVYFFPPHDEHTPRICLNYKRSHFNSPMVQNYWVQNKLRMKGKIMTYEFEVFLSRVIGRVTSNLTLTIQAWGNDETSALQTAKFKATDGMDMKMWRIDGATKGKVIA